MNLYEYDDYKEIINGYIKLNQHIRGYRTKLAEAAGCGSSFFSQVMNSEIHLTVDHGANICEFWELDDEMTDYFLDLMNFQRSASRFLKKRLKERIYRRQTESKTLRKREKFSDTEIDSSLKEALYYSSWHYLAVHVLTAIPKFQLSADIAKKLAIPTSLADRILRDLRNLNLVEQNKERWVVKGGPLRLDKTSPISVINQSNWRTIAMKHLGDYPDDGIHFSGLFAISKKDAKELKNHFNKAIEDAIKTVVTSQEEELVCLNLDYFTM